MSIEAILMDDLTLNVLMVEDIKRHHQVYEMAITDAVPVANVTFASDGQEALDLIQSERTFDLVVLDLNLPKLHGEDVLSEIRKDPRKDSVPVIVLTGDTDYRTQTKLLDMGADDFIEKGAPPEIFVARLRAQMRHKMSFDKLTQLALDMQMFTSGVLHDIRNIETTMVALCDLLLMQASEDIVGNKDLIQTDLKNLKSQAQRLGEYAHEVLQRIRDSATAPDLSAVDIPSVMEWVEELIEAGSEGLNHILTWKVEGEIEDVLADYLLLRLCLLNLAQNSIRYAKPGVSAVVSISQERRPAQTPGKPDRIITRFQDNGVGIQDSEQRRIFEPFYRGKQYDRKKAGLGLGLSLVSRAVAAMGGNVWAETPAGEGACICIELNAATPS